MPHDPDATRPTAEQAARRLLVLKHVVAHSLMAPPRAMLAAITEKWTEVDRQKFTTDAESKRDGFWQRIRRAGLWEDASETERQFARTTMLSMTSRQQINASWRVEASQVLMWALGLVPQLPPYDVKAKPDILKQVPSDDVERFISKASFRDVAEMDVARDVAELWHWRSRTRQLIEMGQPFPATAQMKAKGFASFDDIVRFSTRRAVAEGKLPTCIEEDFPAKDKAYRNLTAQEWSELTSITRERHFALNWLCGYAPGNDWDKTPTAT